MVCVKVVRTVVVLMVVSFGMVWTMLDWEPYSEVELPPMYAMEDYAKCQDRGGTYCRTEIFIRPDDQNSTIAQQIQRSHENPYTFYRSSLFRMICAPKDKTDVRNNYKQYVEKVMDEQLKDYNVTTIGVPSYVCQTVRQLNVFDYLIMAAVLSYVWLIFKGTMYDSKRQRDPNYPVSKYDNWLRMVSIRENWNKAWADNQNRDFQKLKCIQGMRFYNIILVVACHTKISFGGLFLENPMELEKAWSSELFRNSLQADLFVIQINLMISTMLLTNQIYELHEKHGYFSLGHCFNIYANRIIRFLPTMMFMIIIQLPAIKLLPQGSSTMGTVEMLWKGCAENWWATLMQMNYFYKFHDMCMPGSWYLSVDTFVYLTAIVLLNVQLKFRLDIKKVLLVAFLATAFNFGYIIYSNDLDIIYRPTVERVRRLFEPSTYRPLYLSPYSNWSTSCVGIAIGAIFYHTKNNKFKLNTVLQVVWLLTSCFLVPFFAVYVSLFKFEGIHRAIIGPLLKPTYAMAFGIGIIGMSRGYGGFIKKIFEWDFAVKMSNFTFCIYVFHFYIVFGRGVFDRSPTHFTTSHLILCLLQDLILSFLLGMLTTVTVEIPGTRLQKKYVPQIKKANSTKTHHNGLKEE